MTSVEPFDESHVRSPTPRHALASFTHWHSGRVAPEHITLDSEVAAESPPLSPASVLFGEKSHQFHDSSTSSLFLSPPSTARLVRQQTPVTVAKNEDDRIVQISEYRTPENTPFQPLAEKPSTKLLNSYITVTPYTILILALLATLLLVIVVIGLGVVISNRQAQLNYRCPTISYCPRNSSFTVLCNITNQYCQCYNTDNNLIGCFKQRHYGEGCYRSQECSNNDNLRCNLSLYQCQCLDHYIYNGSSCMPMLTYGDRCSTTGNICDYYLNLTCIAGSNCTCNTNYTFWNGQYCELYRSINSVCDPNKIPSGCSSTFTCDNTTATCQCSSSTYFDGKVCLTYSSYLEPCFDSSSCLPNTLLSCLWGLCQCNDAYYYWSSTAAKCLYPKSIVSNSSCDSYMWCESAYGLRCINNRCACEMDSYWTPGNYCDFQSTFGEQCSTAPCLANTGLICSSNTSTCVCPKFYYWDNFVCQYQRPITAFCLADSWCRSDIGLGCRNFSCTCSLCSTCFWDGVRCRDCPTSWQIVVSNGTIKPRVYCYVKVDSYLNWNESTLYCSTAATSYFGPKSHLVYIDDAQELQDLNAFVTTQYYDIFIGHLGNSTWYLTNGTLSPTITWCSGVSTSYTSTTCSRLYVSSACITNIACYGWTSRFVCELD